MLKNVPQWIRRLAEARQNTASIRKLKNRFSGQRCFLIGNGPSLREHNLNLLEQEHVFAVNWFILHPVFEKLKNLYYFVADPNSFPGGLLNPEVQKALLRHPGCSVFFHQSGRRTEPELTKQQNFRSRIHLLRLNNDKTVWNGHFQTNLTRPLCWGWTTLIDLCLPAAVYMGFREIYLLGCDCDYRLEEHPKRFKGYFYSPDALPEYERRILEKFSPSEVKAMMDYVLRSWDVLRKHPALKSTRIYNAGRGGQLHAFNRIIFEDLFKENQNG